MRTRDNATRVRLTSILLGKSPEILDKELHSYGACRGTMNSFRLHRILNYLCVESYLRREVFQENDVFWNERYKMNKKCLRILQNNDPILIELSTDEDWTSSNWDHREEWAYLTENNILNRVSKQNVNALYNMLKMERLEISKRNHIKEIYRIASNQTLMDIVIKQPINLTELMNCKGIGKVRVNKYGTDILRVVKRYKSISKSKRERANTFG